MLDAGDGVDAEDVASSGLRGPREHEEEGDHPEHGDVLQVVLVGSDGGEVGRFRGGSSACGSLRSEWCLV